MQRRLPKGPLPCSCTDLVTSDVAADRVRGAEVPLRLVTVGRQEDRQRVVAVAEGVKVDIAARRALAEELGY